MINQTIVKYQPSISTIYQSEVSFVEISINYTCLALLATIAHNRSWRVLMTFVLGILMSCGWTYPALGQWLSDNLSHPPPLNEPYPFSPPGAWLPGASGFLRQGDTYQDPIFGSTIQRLTDDYPRTTSENYAKNGFWNADGTRLIYMSNDDKIIDASTGAVVRNNVPGNFDSSFAPDDPDIWYYFSGSSLRQYHISTGTTSLVKTFSNSLGPLGGSVDWIDGSGRYMVLKIGSVFRVWDKQTDTLFAGSISENLGTGWIGISPDASYVITAVDGGTKKSYAIDKVAQTVSTNGVVFWTLCGDHADILTASDGKTYMVTFHCWDAPEIYRVDVSIPQNANNSNAARQKQLADNRKLLDVTWNDDGHFSCVTTGSMRDWCFMSTENGGSHTSWWPYKDEIIGVNVLSGEVRRYAHHRSRGSAQSGCYFCQPRVQATWDGSKVLFSSNYGATNANDGEYGELYVITFTV